MPTYDYIFEMKFPTILVGESGVGKSEIIEQYAIRYGYKFFNLRLTEYSEGDIIGMPYNDNGITRFAPTYWFKTACDFPTILLFDEINRASLEVRQAIFRIADSRSMGELKLHPDTKVYGAMNPENDEYQVLPMEKAEKNRWAFVPFHPSFEEWVYYMQTLNDIEPLVLQFVIKNKNFLEGVKFTYANVEQTITRRSWTRLAKNLFNISLSKPQLSQMIFAYVGEFVGSRLISFLEENKFNATSYNPFTYQPQSNNISLAEAQKILAWLSRNQQYVTTLQPTQQQLKNYYNVFNKLPSEEIKQAVRKYCGR